MLAPVPGTACSLAGCIDHGIELNRDFAVTIKHQGKPLMGVTVKVTDAVGTLRFSGMTTATGSVRFTSLPPGDYWLDADFLGIGAGYQCFHVAERPSRHAKQRLSYEWGDLAPATRRIAGKLIDSQPGTGESPIWNLVHRVNVPITEAKLKLENPITRQIYSAVSNQNGTFAFDGVPAGVYVLHIEGGGSGRDYDATDLLIRLSPTASKDAVDLIRREAGGGSCGGTSLELLNTSIPDR